MKRIIILQLARLGDILQTLPAVQGLKKKYPGCEITLVTRSTFADAARISPHVDKIVEFPTTEVLGPYFENPTQEAKTVALAKLIHWIAYDVLAGTTERPYDLLLNLTFSEASSYLASLIPAIERRGMQRSPDDSYLIRDAWSQYFFAQVLGKNFNILHLNDLFVRIAGAAEGAWPLEIVEPTTAACAPELADGRMRVGIQLTASRSDKTLNERVWAVICNAILAEYNDAELVFFGSKADLPVIDATLALMRESGGTTSRCTVVAGTMRFHENVPWLRSCRFVVAPDTAIVHLASICGTRVIEIPGGNVRPDETGPYGEGHQILYPVSPEPRNLAAGVVAAIAGREAEPTVAQASTKWMKTTSGINRSEIVPQNFIQEETSAFFMRAYYLLGEFRCAGRLEDIEVPRLGDPGQPGALDKMVNAYDALCLVRRLAEHGQHHCLKMLENISDRAELKAQMEKISQIESMMDSLQKTVPLVKPLVDTWRVSKDVGYAPSSQTDLSEVLAVTEGVYRELGQNVEIVQQLLQTAVTAAQNRLGVTETELKKKKKQASKRISKEKEK